MLPRADDYTLMSPFGGDPIRGFDDSPECIEAQERFFAGSGEAVLDGVSAQASGDPAVIAAIARQHGEVNSLPPQDLSLRVTPVFRFQVNELRPGHRHADPLVRDIKLERLSALFRGCTNLQIAHFQPGLFCVIHGTIESAHRW